LHKFFPILIINVQQQLVAVLDDARTLKKIQSGTVGVQYYKKVFINASASV